MYLRQDKGRWDSVRCLYASQNSKSSLCCCDQLAILLERRRAGKLAEFRLSARCGYPWRRAAAQSNPINQTPYRRRIQSAVNNALSVFLRQAK